MGLQEAARAELEDREFGQIALRAARFVAGVAGLVHSGERGGLIFSAISA